MSKYGISWGQFVKGTNAALSLFSQRRRKKTHNKKQKQTTPKKQTTKMESKMEALKERMIEACQTGDERVVREIVSSLPSSVGFVLGEVDFLFFVLFFCFFLLNCFWSLSHFFVILFVMMLINSYCICFGRINVLPYIMLVKMVIKMWFRFCWPTTLIWRQRTK